MTFTPEEQEKLKKHIRSISEILVKNTPQEKLKDFESIELAIRDHILKEVSPEIGSFFLSVQQEQEQEELEK
jgi:Trp operon repressor